MSTFESYPENPSYGSGCFRRRIRLHATDREVIAELEDHHHGFRLRLQHDGQQVTAVDAETLRIPFSTCPGAVEPLRKLRGLPISADSQTLLSQSDPAANCTHLYDLCLLAIARAASGPGEHLYDICIGDETETRAGVAEIHLNGQLLHRWLCRDWTIIEPSELAGKALYKGFSSWANAAFSGDAQRAAFALQKGYFVSSARRYDMDAMAGEAANDSRDFMYGACYTYTSPQIDQAKRLANTVRDFSHAEEQLLQFRNSDGTNA